MRVEVLFERGQAESQKQLIARAVAHAFDRNLGIVGAEADEVFPRDVFRTLGRVGLLGLPYGEDVGGSGQPYEVYLQVVEELASVWASVGVGKSRDTFTVWPGVKYTRREATVEAPSRSAVILKS